jgi:hypothetical protein
MTPDEFPSPFSNILADLLADGHVLYDSLCAQMPAPSREKSLAIEIINDVELNAQAANRDDGYVIRINRGAIQHAFGTALGLFCCPRFLPSVRNAAAEVEPKLGTHGFPPIPLTGQDNDTIVLVPQDGVRATIAHLIADVAVYFLLYHEIGHIVGGHLEALNAAYGSTSSISEFGSPVWSQEDISLLHAFECDADAFACYVSSNVLSAKVMAEEVRGLMQTDARPSEDCAFITILTAVSVLFRMLYPTAPATIGVAQGTHPHPAVRDFVVGCCILTRGLTEDQLSVAKLDDLLCDSVRNVEEVWADHCLNGQAPLSPAAWAADVRRGADELFAAHAKHEELLVRYAHLPRSWHDWKWPSP